MTAFLLGLILVAQAGVRVDRVEAVIDKDVIVTSELEAEARIQLVLRAGQTAGQVPLSEEFLSAFLDYLIDQYLVSARARRLGGIEVKDAEVESKIAEIRLAFPSIRAWDAFLRRFDIATDFLRDILRRNLRNERYIAERMRVRLVGSDALLNPSSEQYQDALKTWLRELREASEIRILNAEGILELERFNDEKSPAHP